MNDWLALADVLITDYSSSIFEYALLRRPLILLVADLEAYERDPGLYLDYRTEMIGTQVTDTDGVIEAIVAGRFDTSGHDAFIDPPRRSGRVGKPALRGAIPGGRPFGGEVIPFAAMSATSEAPAAFHNAAGSPGPLALIREGIEDIRSRRRLVRYLVQADVRKRGADTLLGNFWWVLDPLLQMVVYTIFITIVARGHGIPDYPLFIFSAILPWKWFSSSVIDATGSVVSAERLIKQIQFPKLVLPVAATTAGVVGFAFGMIPLALLLVLNWHRATPYVLLIPVIAVVQYVFTLAMAILVSSANVFFRDLRNVAGHVLRLWWFLSPGLYSLAFLDTLRIVEQYPIIKTLAEANPFAILFTAYRQVIYGTETSLPGFPDWGQLALLGIGSVVFLGLATIVFKRLEPNFAKVL